MVDLKIENVIAATELNNELDLLKIAETIKDVEYDPDHFPGLIYKLKSPKTVTLMFSKGYTVCTGAKSIQNAKAALMIIYKKLIDQNLIDLEKVPTIFIQNIIVSYKYKKPLDLASLRDKLPIDDVEYNPKKFPGLIYNDKTTDISALIFKTGVVVGYGSPHLVDIDDVLTKLEESYS
jgi:transcription initiation factor TFIID TATA-box-binding protein